jgi:flagellar motor switch protein FliM
MNQANKTHDPGRAFAVGQLERPLATVASHDEKRAVSRPWKPAEESVKHGAQPHDPGDPKHFSTLEFSKLRLNQEEFVNRLAVQFTRYLRLECSLKLTGLEMLPYQTLAAGWTDTSYFSLFKLDPVRGVSILEIPPLLGLTLVDCLMGGRGNPSEPPRELGEIEYALLGQVVQLILDEWCGHWSKVKALKPVLLGHETNGRFLQTATPETIMLALAVEARFGNGAGQVRICFPYSSLDPLIRRVVCNANPITEDLSTPPAAARWNPCFDEVRVPVTAECRGLELTAGQVSALKVGDLLQLVPQSFQDVRLRLADRTGFNGRLGTLSGQWAVELTETITRAAPL